MKALTLTQPWATLVAIGAKRVETRSWSTRYRGPLAIHAAQGFPKWAKEACEEPAFKLALAGVGIVPIGCVICTCVLVNVLPAEFSEVEEMLTDQERAFGDFAPGRFAWILENVMPVKPVVYAKGALGLWEWK